MPLEGRGAAAASRPAGRLPPSRLAGRSLVAVRMRQAANTGDLVAGSPTLVFTVNGRTTGPVYTTHDLLVRVRLSGGTVYSVDSRGRTTASPDQRARVTGRI